MANRKALRDLQANLDERLKAARTDPSEGASWLAMQAGKCNYLLPLEQAGEIFKWTSVLRVPYTKDWFWGVANLRGNLVGAVDLAAYLGHPIERTEQHLNQASLLRINSAIQLNVALVVDRLLGLRAPQDFVSGSTESMSDAQLSNNNMVGTNYTDSNGTVWQVLQLHQLVQSPDFLNICI